MPLHLVSWNVASWVTTLEQIKKYHTSLSAWLAAHQIDILCLQEVKGTEQKLVAQSAIYGANEVHCFFFILVLILHTYI